MGHIYSTYAGRLEGSRAATRGSEKEASQQTLGTYCILLPTGKSASPLDPMDVFGKHHKLQLMVSYPQKFQKPRAWHHSYCCSLIGLPLKMQYLETDHESKPLAGWNEMSSAGCF